LFLEGQYLQYVVREKSDSRQYVNDGSSRRYGDLKLANAVAYDPEAFS
jgi:hypothetical protein